MELLIKVTRFGLFQLLQNAPPPPPLPPPQRSLNHHSNTSTPPCPGQAVEAAIPFAPHESEYPVQETNPTPGALPGTQVHIASLFPQKTTSLMK